MMKTMNAGDAVRELRGLPENISVNIEIDMEQAASTLRVRYEQCGFLEFYDYNHESWVEIGELSETNLSEEDALNQITEALSIEWEIAHEEAQEIVSMAKVQNNIYLPRSNPIVKAIPITTLWDIIEDIRDDPMWTQKEMVIVSIRQKVKESLGHYSFMEKRDDPQT